MMMMRKEDLGLSLSLGFSQNHHPSSLSNLHMYPWNHHTFLSSSDEKKQQFVRKIEVKRVARSVECEDERGVSSPKSTISSSVSGKRSEREGDETLDGSCSRGGGTWEEEEGGDSCRKKLRLSKDQSALLEDTFKDHNTLNPKQKLALAKKLSLTARQVEVWFQNRRARTKLKQTEVDCEYLKRCVEKLREENRRLQKEAAELRALKLSPQFFNASQIMSPPTTLLMCPSCEPHPLPSSLKTTDSSIYNHSHKQRSLSLNPWRLQMGNGPMLEVKRHRP